MGDKYRLFLQHPLFHKFHISLSNCLYLTIIPQARVVHELIVNEARSTDENEWNNCFIIYSIFSCFFVFSGVAFSRRATISASSSLATILNFTTHRI